MPKVCKQGGDDSIKVKVSIYKAPSLHLFHTIVGRIFPFIAVHEYSVGRSLANRYHLGAFLSAPWLGVKNCVARTQAFIWVEVYMFRGKGVVNIGM